MSEQDSAVLIGAARVPVPGRIVASIERAAQHISDAGAVWTGTQRVQLAHAARSAPIDADAGDDVATGLDPVVVGLSLIHISEPTRPY